MGFCHNCNQEVSSKFCPNCGKEAVELVKNTKDSNTPALIDELYALRSGLSRISQENDKVKEAENSLESKRQHVSSIIVQGDKEGINNEIIYNNKLNNLSYNYKHANTENIQKRKRLENILSYNKKAYTKYKILLIAFLSLLLVSVVSTVALSLSEYDFIAALLFSVDVTFAIASIVFLVKMRKEYKPVKNAKQELDEFNKYAFILSSEQIERNFLNSDIYKSFVQEHEDKLSAYKEAKNFDYSPYENALNEQKNASMEFYKDFYPTYLARFEKVLDPRDWCNLDLVIFILETGRADNLRDALIQVDGYRHTEAIVKAVSSAAQAICRTITSEADRLQRAIATHVDTINSNLVAISKEQKALSDSLGGINASINKQINATELQNALLEKANTSSDRLATDLEEIRNYFIK